MSSDSSVLSIPLDDIIGDTNHLICEVHDVIVKGLTVKCWKYTNPKSRLSKPAVIGIHGGPAFTHRYILPLKLLADDGYPVILYDQG
jgi:pimeloyl-ACP methyl ester carboxylesterase